MKKDIGIFSSLKNCIDKTYNFCQNNQMICKIYANSITYAIVSYFNVINIHVSEAFFDSQRNFNRNVITFKSFQKMWHVNINFI